MGIAPTARAAQPPGNRTWSWGSAGSLCCDGTSILLSPSESSSLFVAAVRHTVRVRCRVAAGADLFAALHSFDLRYGLLAGFEGCGNERNHASTSEARKRRYLPTRRWGITGVEFCAPLYRVRSYIDDRGICRR